MLGVDLLALLGHIFCALSAAAFLSGMGQIAGLAGSFIVWVLLRQSMREFWMRALPGRRTKLETCISACDRNLAITEAVLTKTNEALQDYDSSLRGLGSEVLDGLGHVAHFAGTLAGIFATTFLGSTGAGIAASAGKAVTERTRARDELQRAFSAADNRVRDLRAERSQLYLRRLRLYSPQKPGVSTNRWLILAAMATMAIAIWTWTNTRESETKEISTSIGEIKEGIRSTGKHLDQVANKRDAEPAQNLSAVIHRNEDSSTAPESLASDKENASNGDIASGNENDINAVNSSGGFTANQVSSARREISLGRNQRGNPATAPSEQTDVAAALGHPAAASDTSTNGPRFDMQAVTAHERNSADVFISNYDQRQSGEFGAVLQSGPKHVAEPSVVLPSGQKHVAEPGAVLPSGPKHVSEKGAVLF